MNIRMTAGARQDLLEVADWYDRRRPGLGDEFGDAFDAAVRAILANPRMYARTEEEVEGFETRDYLIARFQFRLVYAVFDQEILIASLQRGRPESNWRSRLTDDS